MKKILLLSLFLLVIPLNSVFAFEVLESSGEAILTGPYYNSSIDQYYIDLEDGSVNKVHYIRYTDDTFSTIDEEKDMYANDSGGTYYESWTFSCNRAYDVTFYDYANFQVGKVRFVASEIQNGTCTSPPVTEDTTNTSESCSTAICECIQQLKAVNDQISTSVNSNGVKLGSINQSIVDNGVKIDQSNDLLGDIKGQFITTQTANYEKFNTLPSIETNKPSQPSSAHVNENVYFKDGGQEVEPSALPIAPEPKEWKDENGLSMTKESTLIKEPKLVEEEKPLQDSVPVQDLKPIKDLVPSKDVVPTKEDAPLQDSIPLQESVPLQENIPIKEDVLLQDAPLLRESLPLQDAVPTRDANSLRDPVLQQAPVLEQAPVDRTPPNWTSP